MDTRLVKYKRNYIIDPKKKQTRRGRKKFKKKKAVVQNGKKCIKRQPRIWPQIQISFVLATHTTLHIHT